MRLSHADFRPGKRPRYVPSGSPRRKFPVIRLVLLLALGVFVYTRFDTVWNSVRAVADPVALWRSATGTGNDAASGSSRGGLVWSGDSSRVSLSCPRGLSSSCCDDLNRADQGLCGAAAALVEKARWKNALRGDATQRPLYLEARAVVGDLGEWGYELAALGGRDGSGAFTFRRTAGAQAWCDTRRGCLKFSSVARAPLADGRPLPGSHDEAAGNSVNGADGRDDETMLRAGMTVVRWASTSPRVRAVLPGRVAKVAAGAGTGNNGNDNSAAATVTVYHGGELYVTYGPLRPAPGVKAGALVKAGSHLGDARPRAHGGGYVVAVGLRRGGQPVDAAAFWGFHDRAPGLAPDLASLTAPSVTAPTSEGTP